MPWWNKHLLWGIVGCGCATITCIMVLLLPHHPQVNQPIETDVGYGFGCVSVVVIVAIIPHLYPESLPTCRSVKLSLLSHCAPPKMVSWTSQSLLLYRKFPCVVRLNYVGAFCNTCVICICLNGITFELYEKSYEGSFETKCILENFIIRVVTLWNGKVVNVAAVVNNN